MSAPPRKEWYRVVDARHQGWHPMGNDTPMVYAADYGFQREGLGGRPTLEELEAERGPLRPVLPITTEDREALEGALEAAGRKAVYTVAVAVQLAVNRIRDEQHGGLDVRGSYDATRTHLLAGREGSWESEALINLMLWGDRTKARRIHEPSRQIITDMIVRWVTDPDRFTEVAATLAETVSSYADEHGGWKAVADQWLQPGGLDKEGVYVTYHLLYSTSAQFDPDVLVEATR